MTSTSSNHLLCDKQKKTLFHEHCHSHTDRRSAHTLSLDRLYAAAEQTVVGNPDSAAAGPEYFSM